MRCFFMVIHCIKMCKHTKISLVDVGLVEVYAKNNEEKIIAIYKIVC